ncbi:hypothetical protein BU24DRAFT_195611 [Aaosphaeria arxii CBS 175.79]|uniref:Uncharacterized protein n=1 Tax=Aaosphaeria arxii CBS 175.79 TaxID=1450172 RepID=A0A6A5XU49_9PLEO|nr:uncharacterized protein BU24DRAFT_195611 [Aaosphaeria arxii CBS 175.79]KAF2016180.1 hypothetical protein BU24DRAFT_195611 [Aaosphaeria arxii CBS 175.79]
MQAMPANRGNGLRWLDMYLRDFYQSQTKVRPQEWPVQRRAMMEIPTFSFHIETRLSRVGVPAHRVLSCMAESRTTIDLLHDLTEGQRILTKGGRKITLFSYSQVWHSHHRKRVCLCELLRTPQPPHSIHRDTSSHSVFLRSLRKGFLLLPTTWSLHLDAKSPSGKYMLYFGVPPSSGRTSSLNRTTCASIHMSTHVIVRAPLRSISSCKTLEREDRRCPLLSIGSSRIDPIITF